MVEAELADSEVVLLAGCIGLSSGNDVVDSEAAAFLLLTFSRRLLLLRRVVSAVASAWLAVEMASSLSTPDELLL